MLEKISEITADLEAQRATLAQLEADLAEAKAAAKEHVILTVRAMIDEAGFTPDEILPLVAPTPKTTKAQGDGRAFPVYALASDPSVTYSRGVLPAKLKDAMVAAGFDPAMGADRAAFKAQYMVQEVDTR